MDRQARALGRALVRAFYRISLHGEPVPESGALVLVANHTNGLVDGGLLVMPTRRAVRFLAKYKIFDIPVVGTLARAVRAIPIYRKKDQVDTAQNADAFAEVHRALLAGEVIGVFPEGESGSEPHLRELKTGAARMALGAEESSGWTAGVRFQPVGIVYEARDRWRSRVTVWCGEPFGVADLRGEYERDPWRAVELAMERVAAAMHSVMVELGAEADRPLLALAEQLLPDDGRPRPERLRALAEAWRWLREHRPDQERELASNARAFLDRLRANRLSVRDLDDLSRPPGGLAFALRRATQALVWTPSFFLGLAAWSAPGLACRAIGRAAKPTPDKLVTTTILAGWALMPAWFVGAPLAVAALASPDHAWKVLALLALTALTLPRQWPYRRLVWRDFRALLRLAPERTLYPLLRSERAQLRYDLTRLDRLARRLAARACTT